MQLWPAIDLRGGKCVRLTQGDYSRETVYGDDPAEMAARWVAEGAQQLHLVDLDGARDGVGANEEAVRRIRERVNVPLHLGGGIRDEATIEKWLKLGISGLVVGTRAAQEPEWFRNTCRAYPNSLVLGLDARNGKIATHGWVKVTGQSAIDFAKMFDNEPLRAIVYTDISKDGMLAGPNFEAMSEMQLSVKTPVIASGGVTTIEDIMKLSRLHMAGAIVGRSLYEGRLSLAAALEALRAGGNSSAVK
jgi:phosphoribosylformimino-5-aminoimidazole carboxamide ribotide isomerase